MYKSEKGIFYYYNTIQPSSLNNEVLKPLREKIKRIILDYPYGEICLMENCFREDFNPKHERICSIIKEKLKRKGYSYKKNFLFYFQYSPFLYSKKPYCIVEPDFLVSINGDYTIIEVKSSNNKENIKKGLFQLLITDFLLNNFSVNNERNKVKDLYLVSGFKEGIITYKVGEDTKSKFYDSIRSYLISLFSKKMCSEQKKIICSLIDTLSIVRERI
jgi:hypothetical protein